ncbi:MAG: ATP-binding protein [Chloroflexi bacterium]|nr:ATP-binding protein [Chloroflexota bacterium]
MRDRQRIGTVIQGSLLEGLTAKLEPSASVESMRVGNFVVIEGQKKQFFSLITDVALGATNEQVLLDPPAGADDFANAVLAGTSTFGTVKIAPMLMLDAEPSLEDQGLRPVKTVPSHFSPVYEADEDDFLRVFQEDTVSGVERVGKKKFFEIGKPLNMEVPVCMDLERFVERSNGIFGKSGTGKSFLARLMLSGIIKSRAAVNLVFDMHSEYGWETQSEETGHFVKGLRQLFGPQVLSYTLDPESARNRNVQPDGVVVIGLNQIQVEDVALLQEELNLTSTAVESSYLLVDRYRDRWLQQLLNMDAETLRDFARESGAHPEAMAALKRKLDMIGRLGFVKEHVDDSVIDEIVRSIESGRHVILEFGQYNNPREYILVANIITRRIHDLYRQKTERYQQTKKPEDRPRQLMITIEEAHKFLNPVAARQTIFGTIAREMRKYFVTLLVIDQRPSGIDTEVLSQIGTKITALLNDEKDIEAVFTGVGGGGRLKALLAALDPRQQALVLGYAVPMPVEVRTRTYDEAFYRAMGHRERDEQRREAEKARTELFGE